MSIFGDTLQAQPPAGFYEGTIVLVDSATVGPHKNLPWRDEAIVGIQLAGHTGLVFAREMVPQAGLQALLGQAMYVEVVALPGGGRHITTCAQSRLATV